jgi:hypothetical protein
MHIHALVGAGESAGAPAGGLSPAPAADAGEAEGASSCLEASLSLVAETVTMRIGVIGSPAAAAAADALLGENEGRRSAGDCAVAAPLLNCTVEGLRRAPPEPETDRRGRWACVSAAGLDASPPPAGLAGAPSPPPEVERCRTGGVAMKLMPPILDCKAAMFALSARPRVGVSPTARLPEFGPTAGDTAPAGVAVSAETLSLVRGGGGLGELGDAIAAAVSMPASAPMRLPDGCGVKAAGGAFDGGGVFCGTAPTVAARPRVGTDGGERAPA